MNKKSKYQFIYHIWLFFMNIIFSMLFFLTDSALSQPQDAGIQRIEIPSSLNPVGSGARALGMGGAFIAIADDATAASWNPGGLIQLGTPEISLVGAFFKRTEYDDFGTHPESSGSDRIRESNINYFSLSHPFTLFNRNMILSLNYQHLFDFSSQLDFPFIQRSQRLSLLRNLRYEQDGQLTALGLAYSVQMTTKLSLGFTLNIWEDWLGDNGWENTSHESGTGIDHVKNAILNYESYRWNRYSFSGFNANIGILWNINDKLTCGAVLKTPFTADLKHESMFNESVLYPEIPDDSSTNSDVSSVDEKLDMPISLGIGIAYRFSDHLTVSGDIYRTEWQNFILKDSDGNRIAPISGLTEDESDIDPTHQIRVGAEYLFFNPAKSKYIIPLRCGLFYDPAPGEKSPDEYYGFSLGTGIVMGKLVFDMAYQYRFGNDVKTFMLQHLDFSEDVKEHTFYSSVIIHF